MTTLLFTLLGAVLASFANVVASRGPRQWGLVAVHSGPAGFAHPPSQCEACGRRLNPLELIPVLSFLVLRGRCRACGASIGWRHFIVELLGVMLGLIVAIHFGLTPEAASAAILLFILLCLAVIDWETGYLPDALTWPLLGLGLLVSALPQGQGLVASGLGAVIGGGGLWLVAWGYQKFRGREGLGGGDVKLVAAAGAWCGAAALPFILLAASLSGLLYAGAAMLLGKKERAMTAELRFGPFLAAAIAIVYLAGPPLTLAH